MAVKIGSARIDERGKISGGKAGDQTGNEVGTQNWYKHSKGWRVLRPINPSVAEKMAQCMESACANNKIGYDQVQRNTLYNLVKPYGFDVRQAKTTTETDCSALVRVCAAYAGIAIPDYNTSSQASTMLKTGAFTELKDSKYTTSSNYLRRGDVLVTKTKGHTVIVLSNGPKAGVAVDTKPTVLHLGDRILRNGVEGEDVKEYQEMLIQAGGDLSPWGADGDFGDTTEIETRELQRKLQIDVDGEVGPQTIKALTEYLADKIIINAKKVKIINGNCYVRPQPNTLSQPIGTARRGQEFEYLGETSADGWNKIKFENKVGWVSGKYSEKL